MRLSNLADYAVVTMAAAARHCGGARTSAAELAAETGLPAPTVQKVVSKLSAAGLLRSIRGAKGGLQLARPAAAITLADIVEAVEGPIALTACVEGIDGLGVDVEGAQAQPLSVRVDASQTTGRVLGEVVFLAGHQQERQDASNHRGVSGAAGTLHDPGPTSPRP